MTMSNGEKLVRAYPSFLDRVEGGSIVWKDGTRLPLADGVEKNFETWLAADKLAIVECSLAIESRPSACRSHVAR